MRLAPLLLSRSRGDSLRDVLFAAIVSQQQNNVKSVAILKSCRFKSTSSCVSLPPSLMLEDEDAEENHAVPVLLYGLRPHGHSKAS